MIIRNSTWCNVCKISLLSRVSLGRTSSLLDPQSKKGNANKGEINWMAKSKKIFVSINPEEGEGLLYYLFFFFCFLVRGCSADCGVIAYTPLTQVFWVQTGKLLYIRVKTTWPQWDWLLPPRQGDGWVSESLYPVLLLTYLQMIPQFLLQLASSVTSLCFVRAASTFLAPH